MRKRDERVSDCVLLHQLIIVVRHRSAAEEGCAKRKSKLTDTSSLLTFCAEQEYHKHGDLGRVVERENDGDPGHHGRLFCCPFPQDLPSHVPAAASTRFQQQQYPSTHDARSR